MNKGFIVPQNCFHRWYVLIRLIQEGKFYFRKQLEEDFFQLYYDSWITPHMGEEEILFKYKVFVSRYPVIKSNLSNKEYYWELLDDHLKYATHAEKWLWMYNMVVKKLLPIASKAVQTKFKYDFDQNEIEWKLNWNDELFD